MAEMSFNGHILNINFAQDSLEIASETNLTAMLTYRRGSIFEDTPTNGQFRVVVRRDIGGEQGAWLLNKDFSLNQALDEACQILCTQIDYDAVHARQVEDMKSLADDK